jgi:hypothetical protein
LENNDYDIEDSKLTIKQKLQLINSINYWQAKRWRRLKYWRNCALPMKDRHFFMRKEIELIRRQHERLMKLKQEVLQ